MKIALISFAYRSVLDFHQYLTLGLCFIIHLLFVFNNYNHCSQYLPGDTGESPKQLEVHRDGTVPQFCDAQSPTGADLFTFWKKKTVKVYQYEYQMKGLHLRVKNLLLVDRFCCFLMWDWS